MPILSIFDGVFCFVLLFGYGPFLQDVFVPHFWGWGGLGPAASPALVGKQQPPCHSHFTKTSSWHNSACHPDGAAGATVEGSRKSLSAEDVSWHVLHMCGPPVPLSLYFSRANLCLSVAKSRATSAATHTRLRMSKE